MRNSGLILYILLFISCNHVVLTSSEYEQHPQLNLQPNKHVAMFVFGDSLFDCGNNNFLNISIDYKANYPPYGETFFHYPTGRFCDGRIISDLAASHIGLPLWRPYLQPGNHSYTVGASFASAGGAALVETNPQTLNLEIQLGYFKEVVTVLKQQLGEEYANNLLKSAIYLSGIGGVDYMAFGSSYSDATESERQGYVDIVIGNITNAVKEIYELGGRKFAFQNVGPIGCLPEARQTYDSGHDCVEIFQTLVAMHNDALSFVAEELESELPGFKYLIFDYFNLLMDRSQNPTKFGFKVGDVACCGTGSHRGVGCGTTATYELCSDPSEYVFYDGTHPTESCNLQLMQLLWKGTTNVTRPINMSQLYELDADTNGSSYGSA